jgi:hypothetical protein
MAGVITTKFNVAGALPELSVVIVDPGRTIILVAFTGQMKY